MSNQFSYLHILSKIEECESAIDDKYTALLEMNERTYRQIDLLFEESLERKLKFMSEITSSSIEGPRECRAKAPTLHA
jgi:hypothetical protein